MTERIIEISNLSKRFKKLVAVNNLNLNVYRGDVFGFLGPNGAGKSTTIRMMLSLIKPSAGNIKLFEKDINKYRKEILKKVGAIVEKPDFYLYLTAFKNLEILGKLSNADVSKKNIMKILDLVGLSERAQSKVKTYSHGMKQRLGIAQALLHNPELIVLDEPTVGLDPHGIKEVRELIKYLSAEKKITIFLSSHILKEIELVSNRMIIINKGTTLVEGYVQELLNKEESTIRLETQDNQSAKILIQDSGYSGFLKDETDSEIILKMDKNDVPGLVSHLVSNKIGIYSVEATNSLEDYFLKITEHS